MAVKKLSPIIIAAICAGFVASCTPKAARIGASADGVPAQRTPAFPKEDSRHDQTPGEWGDTRVAGAEDDMSFARPDGAVIEEIQRDDIADGAPVEADALDLGETRPVSGGRAVIYLQRGFADEAAADMTRLNPFGADGVNRDILVVTDSTHRRIELTLAREIRRANGRKATALDFVELWSRYMKSRPAQGLALFRNVQGAEGYVTGKDPVVSGISAADENVIRIRLAKPDPLAFHRMVSPKLISGEFMLGAYYTSAVKEARHILLPNPNSLSSTTAFFQECAIQIGGDPAPMESFAAGKYAAMTLYSAKDHHIAKTELQDKAVLHELPPDRYFLSCKFDDPSVRRYIRSIVNDVEMFKLAAVARGEPIGSVTTRDDAIAPPQGHVPVPQIPKPFRIIYRSDDPVSSVIAEKLAADLAAAGLRVDPRGGAAEVYERSLAAGAYDCAVGWTSETVLSSQTEQLHFASMWFADETDPKIRINDFKEIPLFSVNNYLLLRNDVRLHRNNVCEMWIDPEYE